MATLRARLDELLGTAAASRPSHVTQAEYHAKFVRSGQEKAKDVLADLVSRFGSGLDTFAYLSIGGSTGSELIYALENSAIARGILLEFDSDAADEAKRAVDRLQLQGKTLRVICGDATQKITQCRKELCQWRDQGHVSGLVCSAQAVLHELPRRSPRYQLDSFLGEVFWDWDPCVFYTREPCSPQGWPKTVSVALPDLPSELLEELARNVQARLEIPGDVRRVGPAHVSMPTDLAVEVLMKIFYIDDYRYEIEERLTSLDPDGLVRVIESLLGANTVTRRYLNSRSFEEHYRNHGVSAMSEGATLAMPLAFVGVVAVRNSAAAIPEASSTPSTARFPGRVAPTSNETTTNVALRRQKQAVLNTPLLPWTPRGGPSLGFLLPDLLVDPTVVPHKRPSGRTKLLAWLTNFSWDHNVAIIGAPGAGKSTALRSLFLFLAERAGGEGAANPVIGHAADYLAFLAAEQSLSGSVSASFTAEALRAARSLTQPVVYLLDGLDELDEPEVDRLLRLLIPSMRAGDTCWMCCRSEQFARNVASSKSWGQLFTEHLEICAWDAERDSMPFIEKYAQRLGQPKLLDRFLELQMAYSGLTAFLANPFMLTLVLYLSHDDLDIAKNSFANPHALYREFYRHWLQREGHRGTSGLDKEVVRQLHRTVAIRAFRARAYSLGRRERLETDEIREALSDSAFSGILEIADDNTLVGFRHETLGEFLLAEQVCNAFFSGPRAMIDALEVTYDYNVNNFVRDALCLLTREDRLELVQNLSRSYLALLRQEFPSDGSVVSEAEGRGVQQTDPLPASPLTNLVVREQLLYYLGRIPDVPYPDVLGFAFEREQHSLLKRCAALSAILHGSEAIEREYLGSLEPGTSADIENRSVQLIYFGDVRGDIYRFRDDGNWPWHRTRHAIFARLASDGYRDKRLRWWDLRTLYLFCVSRSAANELRDADLAVLSSTTVDDGSSDRIAAMVSERNRLLTVLSRTSPP